MVQQQVGINDTDVTKLNLEVYFLLYCSVK